MFVLQVRRSYASQGEILPIDSIIESDTFWGPPETVTYSQAGSFVNFLFVEYGVDKLKVRSGIPQGTNAGRGLLILRDMPYSA